MWILEEESISYFKSIMLHLDFWMLELIIVHFLMIKILKKYNAYNAANLDGGASSIMVINNEIVNNPVGYGATGERRHPNAWIVK